MCPVDIKNMSPDKISVGYANSKDLLFVEVFKASDMSQLEETKRRPFVSAFRVESNEGQKLETFLGDHYGLDEPRRYLARPILVHDGYRFEGQYRAFDIVPGMKIATAVQMFSNRSGVRRVFDLLQWTRKGCIHLFLAARDEVTHCYERPLSEGFPYNLFAMVHATSPEEAHAQHADLHRAVVAELGHKSDTVMLLSTKEYKKTSMTFFTSGK